MKTYIAILICLIANTLHTAAQTTFTVMEYNCENAFDTIHDEGKNDYAFLKDGEKRWRRWQLQAKLEGIAKVIAAASQHKPTDLVALCEVENDSVMTQLVKRTALAAMSYKYIMTQSTDNRGIDVALMYSPFTFHPFDIQHIRPRAHTRDILRVSGTVNTGDTLDVYVLHLPSMLGGSKSKRSSLNIVERLKANIDSLTRHRTHPNVIVMGDFNALPKSPQLRLLTKHTPLTDVTRRVKPGTYKYRGVWETLDHIVCRTTTLRHSHSQVLTLPFLLEDDPTYGGSKPRRTHLGTVYKGGVSDHLPLVSTFIIKR